ncbi:Quino protein amine dehydrogenase [Hygrophoropsis aurantiaca]|uniref:Quino protein amine dehydrogenase n=1 Tax=Hygrophoropsis aurantiaca TaxID=72124 RepID=A0ACB8AFI6_9AGAM|nr:Quino protein amine dehydrogenase [Hygrophoropsis aurantiaca]
MSEDIPKPTVQNPLVNSSVVPESPCIKIFDIRNLVPDGYDQKNLSPINYYIAPTSRADTFYFLVCPWGGTCIQIWDDHTCQLVGTIDPQFTSFPYQWHVTGDGNTLLVVSGSGAGQASLLVDLWDIHSSTLVRKLETGAVVSQPYVSISPDARKLAYRDDYGKVHIYNLNTDIQWSSQTLQGSHIIVGWSPTSDHLLACTLNGHAIVWRVTDSTFECVTDIQLDRSGISLGWNTDIVFSGDKIIYLNKKLGIIIRPLENEHLQLRVRRHISSTQDIAVPRALSPDGQMLACTTPNHNCIIIATASGNIIGGLKLGKDGLLCFSSNGKQLVSMSRFDDIRVWDIEAAIEQYRAANSQTEGSTSSPNEGSSTSTPVAPRNAPRARSNSSDSSILTEHHSHPRSSPWRMSPHRAPLSRHRPRHHTRGGAKSVGQLNMILYWIYLPQTPQSVHTRLRLPLSLRQTRRNPEVQRIILTQHPVRQITLGVEHVSPLYGREYAVGEILAQLPSKDLVLIKINQNLSQSQCETFLTRPCSRPRSRPHPPQPTTRESWK